jgi:hypothetical protein
LHLGSKSVDLAAQVYSPGRLFLCLVSLF